MINFLDGFLFRKLLVLFCLVLFSWNLKGQVTVSGELRKWHTVSLLFDGPMTAEDDAYNPFANYRLNVTFVSPTGEVFVVPGFYAADGDAANTSASSGNKWAVRFKPNAIGEWSYTASFRTGIDVAASLEPNAGTSTSFDGTSGNFVIVSSNKTVPDNRARGRLNYVGKRYLQYEETGKYYLKAGADSPETMLAYDDFDNTPNSNKDWSAHLADWNAGDPVWQGNKGRGLIGAINYLSGKGMNAYSFVTNDIDDPQSPSGSSRSTLWPWVASSANDLNDQTPIEKDNRKRYDISKLEQWEIVFNHGDNKGMYLHFKLQEDGNHFLIDNLTLGAERKLYYREFIARFGHHLALNWNIGEEFWIYNPTLINSFASYIRDVDPYDHNIVIHCYPFEQDENLFRPLLGNAFNLSGISIQAFVDSTNIKVKKWVRDSEASGKPWAVAFDEQAHWDRGVGVDADHNGPKGTVEDNRKEIRHNLLWGALLAGGAGVEYYFGRKTGQTDHNAEDWRSRESKWEDAKIALDFFEANLNYWEMQPYDDLVSGDEMLNFSFAKLDDTYVVYLAEGGEATLDLSNVSGAYTLKWFDPRSGGSFLSGSILEIEAGASRSLGIPPNNPSEDWVVLIERIEQAPEVSVTGITIDPEILSLEEGTTGTLTHEILPSNASNTNISWSSSDTSIATVDQNGVVTAVAEGTATVTVSTEDGGFTATSTITVTLAAISVTGITIDPAELSLDEGTTGTLIHEILPTDATNTNVSWSSSDTSITTVDQNGLVTAVAEGTATITVSTEDGGFMATSTVTVTPAIISVTGITIDPEILSLVEGTTGTLTHEILPSNASNTNVSWSSSDTSIATVDQNGVVTAVAEGTATITVSTEDGGFTDSTAVTVVTSAIEITEIILTPSLLNLVVNQTSAMQYEIVPQNATEREVLWSSDNEAVATVDQNGVVTALAQGEAIISIRSINNQISDESVVVVSVPVNEAPIARILATPIVGIAPLEVAFDASNSSDDQAFLEYVWDFADGNTSQLINPRYIFETPGTYEVQLFVTDQEGLESSASVTIEVRSVDSDSSDMTLFPSPASTEISVSFGDAEMEVFGIRIYDYKGRMVNSYISNQIEETGLGTYRIRLPQLSRGIYVLEAFTTTSERFSRKFLILD